MRAMSSPVISGHIYGRHSSLCQAHFSSKCTFMSNFNERLTPNAALFWSVLVEIGMKS
ncbi:hypothetical protein KIN20_017464 [Parelaphostrongylus tenuis]|uniref:Uncharacterized protein n=1 Tax=Parelaphostrongylus tenuis TaxID=148309 RepID=A0AAD5QRG6_PARTN|nr:hypothetical protein KIN20_017464 [Parelaphostrongylus tenuis]